MTSGQKAWALERWEQISQHRKPLPDCSPDELWRGELDLELAEYQRLSEHHQQINQKLRQLAAEDERVQLLQTIPGVGRKTAEVVVAYVDDPHRFQNARQVSSYAGLVPEALSVRRDGSPGPDPQTRARVCCAAPWSKPPG